MQSLKDNTGWRVSPVAWPAIVLAVAAESVSNALRAYGLGMHLDRYTLAVMDRPVSLAGAVLVLAAVAVSLTQARAAWVALTPKAPVRQRIVAGLAAALLLAISVLAMATHILEAQRAKASDEGGERGRFDRAAAAHAKATDELAKLKSVRSTAEVKTSLDAAPVDRAVFGRTKQCTDVTRPDSFEACRTILDLRQEMARSIRKQELEHDVARLSRELATLKRPEAAHADEAAVAGVWAWIMGIGVVFVATFGSVIFARAMPVPPATANDNPVPAPVPPDARTRIIDWVREFEARNGRKPIIPEVQRAFAGTPKTSAWRYIKAA